MLLQEVNPLPEKASAFVSALKAFGPEYTEVHQADACGIRLFGLRLIPWLNNGMAVLAKAPLRLRKVVDSSSAAASEAVASTLACSSGNSDTR